MKGTKGTVLLAGGARSAFRGLSGPLRSEGYACVPAPPADAVRTLATGKFDLMLIDATSGGRASLDVLAQAREQHPGIPAIVATGEPGSGAEALRRGAFDYVTTPIDRETLLGRMRNALESSRLREGLEARVRERTAALQRANLELQASEEKYRTIFENSAVAITLTDKNENIVSWNQLTETLLGMGFEDLYMLPVRALYPRAEWRKIRAQNLRQKGIQHHMETRVINRNLQTIDVDLSLSVLRGPDGKPAGSIGIIRDITERLRMRRALQESEKKFRTIFEGAATGIALVDMYARPIDINPALQRTIGYTLDELRSLNQGRLIHDDEARADAQLFRDMLAGKRDHYQVEKRYRRKDGGVVWVRQDLSLVRDADGNPQYMIAMMEDVTERKKAEEERERMEQQLQLAGRLAAVGQLSAGVAHELNNPLAAVQGFAQLVSAREDLDETLRADLQMIYEQAQRAAKVTKNLLSFARKYRPEKRLVSINECVERSAELHAYRMRVNNIELVLELDPALPETLADFHQMQQVFVNIITNAEQAMTEAHKGGTLRIWTETADGMVRTSFADDGPGIPAENLERVFDPFFTTKEVGTGTGLGLSICYGLIQQHDGRLYARSRPGEGTTFVVEIPVVSADDPAAQGDPLQALWS